MFSIIGIMLTGVTLGYLFRNRPLLHHTEKTISYTIVFLLFILGLSIGSNEQIIGNLATFGGWSQLHGRGAPHDNPLLRQRHAARSHPPRPAHRHERSFLRLPVLPALNTITSGYRG